MALPNSLGYGGTGWHGDDAVSTRTTLSKLVTLANEIKTDHAALVAKLDLDGGAADTNYAALHGIGATAASAVPGTLGQAGSFLHGDDGVRTRLILESLRTLANEAKAEHNAVRTKLDADGTVTDTDYASVVATDEVQIVTIDATAGTFTLTWGGDTTDAIAEGASAAAVQTALEGLAGISIGDVVVTGSAGGPYTVTFGGNLADEDVAALTGSGALLTKAVGTGTAAVATTKVGGSAHTPTHATTTAGVAAVNEVQTVTVDATSGNFTLTYAGQTTASIAFDAAPTVGAASIRARLEDLSNIAPGDVAVTGGPGNSGGTTPYTITFGGALAGADVAQVTAASVDLAGGGAAVTTGTTTPGVAAVNEVQTVTLIGGPNAGTFSLTYSGQTSGAISATATGAAVKAALEALSNIAADDLTVVRSGAGTLASPYVHTVTFGGTLAATNVDQMTSTDIDLDVNEVQTVTVTGNGGTFTITYSGQTTSDIAYDASSAAVQTALEALSNIAPGDVVVTGGPGDATGSVPYVLSFGGALADTDLAEVTTSVAALMAVGTVGVSTDTPGVTPSLVVAADVAAIPVSWGAGGSRLSGDGGIAFASTIGSLVEVLNEIKAKHNLLLPKLDADLTDTNYAATLTVAAADAI